MFLFLSDQEHFGTVEWCVTLGNGCQLTNSTQTTFDLPFLLFLFDHPSTILQALGSLLRAERPDVEERRTKMLQLQGEQSVKVPTKLVMAHQACHGRIQCQTMLILSYLL